MKEFNLPSAIFMAMMSGAVEESAKIQKAIEASLKNEKWDDELNFAIEWAIHTNNPDLLKEITDHFIVCEGKQWDKNNNSIAPDDNDSQDDNNDSAVSKAKETFAKCVAKALQKAKKNNDGRCAEHLEKVLTQTNSQNALSEYYTISDLVDAVVERKDNKQKIENIFDALYNKGINFNSMNDFALLEHVRGALDKEIQEFIFTKAKYDLNNIDILTGVRVLIDQSLNEGVHKGEDLKSNIKSLKLNFITLVDRLTSKYGLDINYLGYRIMIQSNSTNHVMKVIKQPMINVGMIMSRVALFFRLQRNELYNGMLDDLHKYTRPCVDYSAMTKPDRLAMIIFKYLLKNNKDFNDANELEGYKKLDYATEAQKINCDVVKDLLSLFEALNKNEDVNVEEVLKSIIKRDSMILPDVILILDKVIERQLELHLNPHPMLATIQLGKNMKLKSDFLSNKLQQFKTAYSDAVQSLVDDGVKIPHLAEHHQAKQYVDSTIRNTSNDNDAGAVEMTMSSISITPSNEN